MKNVLKVFIKRTAPSCTHCGSSNTVVLEATDTNFCLNCNKSF